MAELKNVYSGEAVEAALQFVAMGVGGFLEKSYGDKLVEKMPEDLQRAAMANTDAAIETRKMKQFGMAGILGAIAHAAGKKRDEPQEKPSNLGDLLDGLVKAIKEDMDSKKAN